ncbi:MAG: zinc dependent phospholipase C family protein [Lachnospiraceae bacterium]|nr:zinc dependent phospholipase C family protein [Lachnospiraceae bacterium]
MRKKSHISLARFLIKEAGDEVLRRRWKAFYVGSLLPDCRPSFLTVRHEYDETFDLVEQKIRCLVEKRDRRSEDSMGYMIDLGQIFHYIADYFTFPHNSNYPGSLKDHCIYEKYLKFRLRSFIREGDAYAVSKETEELSTVEEILDYIRRNHGEYMKTFRSVEEDCEYITRVCRQVLTAMVCLVHQSSAVSAA